MGIQKLLDRQNEISEEAQKERSYLWMARAFGVVAVVTLIADLILLSALYSLMPVVRVQPFFISTQDKDKQVINIQRANTATLRSPVLQEAFVRQYLTSRLGISSDVEEVKRRWQPGGTVEWMSSTSVFVPFLEQYARSLIKQAETEGLTRDVFIRNVTPIPRADGKNLWRAEVSFSDMSRSLSEPQSSEWVIELVIQFGALRNMTWEERLRNPLGFSVVSYSQKRKDNKL